VLGVDSSALLTLLLMAAASLVALAFIGRPLVFASLQSELAEARGVPLRFRRRAFLAIVAVATAECAQIVGVLLVFTLMVGPAARRRIFPRARGASRCRRPGARRGLGGLTLAFYTELADQLLITALSDWSILPVWSRAGWRASRRPLRGAIPC